VSYQRAGELIAQLQLEVQELVTRAEQADTHEAKETLDIPPNSRAAKLAWMR